MSAMHEALADDAAALMSPVSRPPLSAVPLPSPLAPPRGMSRRQARALKRASRTSRRAESTWTGGHKRIAVLLAIAALGIAGVAFWALFGSTTAVMRPWMGPRSWMVPVAGEIAFMYFFGSSILHAMRRAPSGAIRPLVTWLIVAGSVVIQAEASRHHVHVHGPAPRGVLVSLVGHEVIVVAFYGVLLSAKSTVMILLGGKVRADRITFAEWVAHPVQAGRLWRWRATWGEPSADAARERYMRLLFAETIAQADPRVGREEGWREKLPAILAYQLSTGLFPGSVASAGGDWQETVRCHVESQLALLPAALDEGSAEGSELPALEEASGEATEEELPALPGKPEGSRGGNAGGSEQGTRQGSRTAAPEGSREGSDWPERKDLTKAELTRRVRSAITRYERANDGKRMPAVQLPAAIKVRMSKDSAYPLLREVYAQVDAQRATP